MNTENTELLIKIKVQEYITEVDKKSLSEGFFDIEKARKLWSYEKLAELELRIESLENKPNL